MTKLSESAIRALWVANGGPISVRLIGNSPFGGGGSSVPAAAIMARIAMLESGGETTAEVHDSDDDSYGLWQINLKPGANDINILKRHVVGLRQPKDLLKASVNARAAVYLFSQSQFNPWTTAERAGKEIMIDEGQGDLPGTAAQDANLPGISYLEDLGKLLAALVNPTFWKWVGLGALGIFIVLIATMMFTDTGQTVTKAVTKGKG